MSSLPQPRFSRRTFLLTPLFLFPLLVHAYLGTYSRFIADDFCSAATAHSFGIVRGAAYWYSNWSGRYSANFLDAVCGFLGPTVTPYATMIILIIWLTALTDAAHSAFKVIQDHPSIALSVLTAVVVVFVTLEVTPNVGQSLYWGQGMRSLIPPLIGATIFAALTARSILSETVSLPWLLVAAALTFVAGGFSETYVSLQTAGLTIALAVSLVAIRRKRAPFASLLGAGLVGSVSALIIVAAAPGNAVRRTPFPAPPAPPGVLRISLVGFLEFFLQIFSTWISRLSFVGVVVFAFVVGAIWLSEKRQTSFTSISLVLLPIIAFLLLFICHVPIAYGASLNLPDRTLVIPAYLLVIFTFSWSLILGIKLRPRIREKRWTTVAGVVVLLMFGVTAVSAGLRRARLSRAFRAYAHEWDAREQDILTAKSRDDRYVQVRRLYNWAALDEVEPDPKIFWLTKCVQDYYGIEVLTDYDGPPDPNVDSNQRDAESAAAAIKPSPAASAAPINSFYRPGRGVAQFYTTNATYDQVKAHYESEFARNGWKLFGERKLEIFQRYNGGMHALFCKDHLAANLFYTGGEAPRLGYNYSIAFNWGLSSGFVWGKEDCK